MNYAGFWKRLAAFIIDQILLTIVCTPVVVVILVIMGVGVASMGDPEALSDELASGIGALAQLAMNGVCLVIYWIYYALMESSGMQGTLGKMILGIQVTDANGNKLTFLRATGRFFSRILSHITCCLGYLTVFFTDKQQALHDMVASTLVVNKE